MAEIRDSRGLRSPKNGPQLHPGTIFQSHDWFSHLLTPCWIPFWGRVACPWNDGMVPDGENECLLTRSRHGKPDLRPSWQEHASRRARLRAPVPTLISYKSFTFCGGRMQEAADENGPRNNFADDMEADALSDEEQDDRPTKILTEGISLVVHAAVR
eukprot:1139987-Pelagomonas_calceolata.AAC.9